MKPRCFRYRAALAKRRSRLAEAGRRERAAALARLWDAYVHEPDHREARRLFTMIWFLEMRG